MKQTYHLPKFIYKNHSKNIYLTFKFEHCYNEIQNRNSDTYIDNYYKLNYT